MVNDNSDPDQLKNLSALLDQTMSEEELQSFETIMDSENFQEMVRAYHAVSALNTIRYVVLGLIEKESIPVEIMLSALIAVWIDQTAVLHPKLDLDSMRNTWLSDPESLCKVLLQHAVDSMYEKEHELKQDIAPELIDMYQQWQERLPAFLSAGQIPERWQELLEETYLALKNFQVELQNNTRLQLENVDYQNVWTHMLLQFYLFTYFKQPDFYYVLATNWNIFSQRNPLLIELLSMLRGYEELLLPENRDKLVSLLNDPKVQELMAGRQN